MKLVLMRHGESEANFLNYWTGWLDVPLTETGKEQARLAGEKIKNLNISFSFCGTSLLSRSILSCNLVLEAIDQLSLPQVHTWRLNERHYGALMGVNKDEMIEKYGKKQVQQWRRGYHVALPKSDNHTLDRRYNTLDKKYLPQSESLADCAKRVLPFYFAEVVPVLKDNKNVLLVAHGNSLRGLIKYLENIPDEKVEDILVPNATPIVYELNKDLTIMSKDIL